MRVLVIEDCDNDAVFLGLLLKRNAHVNVDMHVETTLRAGLEYLATHSSDVIILDYFLPDSAQIDPVKKIKNLFPKVPLIVLTSLEDEKLALRSLQSGAEDFLVKGALDEAGLFRSLRYAIERHRATERSYEANMFLDSIVENIPAMIFVKDAQRLSFVRFNKAAEDLLGIKRDEVIGKTDRDFFPTEQADFFISKDREVLNNGKIVEIQEEPINTKFKGIRTLRTVKVPLMDEQGAPRYLLGISEDITDRKNAEKALKESQEQLFLAQKSEAIGRLAGGIAHDFNNLLSTILGFCKFLMDSFDKNDSRRDDIREIITAGDRAAALTRQLLAFSRKQVMRPAVFNLNECVRDFAKIIRRTVGEDIQVVMSLSDTIFPIQADQTQIEQVLLNMTINARDAMPNGGVLTFETFNQALGTSRKAGNQSIPPGQYVVFRITDTGSGISADNLENIFEPFFTTKELGKGTGLGLSTAYGIVRQSGGHITVESTVGKGTAFEIYLPKARKEASRGNVSSAPVPSVNGSETVLLVEDEKPLRDLMTRIFKSKGYTVLAAQDGPEALNLCAEASQKIELMVSDVMIPGIKGKDLADKVKTFNPAIHVIFLSGYPGDIIGHHGILESDINFMHKPFDPDVLLMKARGLLDGKKTD